MSHHVTRSAHRTAASAAVAAVVLATTSGCVVAELITEEKTQHYETRADAPTRGDLAFVLPEQVPDDATDITVRVKTTVPDLKAWDWVSDSGELPEDCTPSDPPTEVDPFFTSGGWPEDATTRAGVRCGAAQVTEVDGRYYSWLVP